MNFSRTLAVVSLFGLLGGPCGFDIPKQTFISPDRAYQFQYSRVLVVCAHETPRNAVEPGEWSWKTTACLDYSRAQIRADSRTFSYYGGFVLEEPKEEVTERACLDVELGGEKKARDKEIHGVKFKVFYPDQTSASANGEREIYRTYHRNHCYSLTIWKQWTETNPPDPKAFKEYRKESERSMKSFLTEPVKTFEFLQ